jgi:hypothetical protein
MKFLGALFSLAATLTIVSPAAAEVPPALASFIQDRFMKKCLGGSGDDSRQRFCICEVAYLAGVVTADEITASGRIGQFPPSVEKKIDAGSLYCALRDMKK